MWKRENFATHKVVTLYEEHEFKELEEKLAKYKDILYNIHKAEDTCTPIDDIEDFIGDEEILDEIHRRRDEEWNAESAELKKCLHGRASRSISAKNADN